MSFELQILYRSEINVPKIFIPPVFASQTRVFDGFHCLRCRQWISIGLSFLFLTLLQNWHMRSVSSFVNILQNNILLNLLFLKKRVPIFPNFTLLDSLFMLGALGRCDDISWLWASGSGVTLLHHLGLGPEELGPLRPDQLSDPRLYWSHRSIGCH